MEKIKINSIEKKGVVCIVKYNPMPNNEVQTGINLEATLNINFNSQEISYLENDVGIGGEVSVEITNKEKVKGNVSAGYWVNITKVDFDSAVKTKSVILNIPSDIPVRGFTPLNSREYDGERSLNGQEQSSLLKEANNEILKLKTLGSQEKFRTPKEMVATELVKAVIGQPCGSNETFDIKAAVEMYHKALELLG